MAPPADEELAPGEVRRSLERIERKLDGLKFVHPDTYEADKRTTAATISGLGTRVTKTEQELQEKADKESLDNVRTLAMWALGLVCTVTFGVIVTGILALVAKGP